MRWKKEFESELPQTFDSIEIGMTGIIFRKKILLMAKSDASKKKMYELVISERDLFSNFVVH